VRQVQAAHGVSERRSCVALGVDRSTIRYRSTKPDQAPLRLRIRDLTQTRVRYGYFRIYLLLRREGWMVNHKRVNRLYREEGLSLRPKRPRRRNPRLSSDNAAPFSDTQVICSEADPKAGRLPHLPSHVHNFAHSEQRGSEGGTGAPTSCKQPHYVGSLRSGGHAE
jgi:transposase InsO family protein